MSSLFLGIRFTIRCLMFYAIILMCTMVDGQYMCVEAHDDYGPYIKRTECETRIVEMTKSINEIYPNVNFVDYKCKKANGIET